MSGAVCGADVNFFGGVMMKINRFLGPASLLATGLFAAQSAYATYPDITCLSELGACNFYMSHYCGQGQACAVFPAARLGRLAGPNAP